MAKRRGAPDLQHAQPNALLRRNAAILRPFAQRSVYPYRC